MQMEVDFFSAQPGISSAPAVGMLVVDFDDTCTATDTTSQVFNAAIAANVENAPGAAGPKKNTDAFCMTCPKQSQQHATCTAGLLIHLQHGCRLHCPPCMNNERKVMSQFDQKSVNISNGLSSCLVSQRLLLWQADWVHTWPMLPYSCACPLPKLCQASVAHRPKSLTTSLNT